VVLGLYNAGTFDPLSSEMIIEKKITLILHPGRPVEARIVELTGQLIDTKMADAWWGDDSLKATFTSSPIDRRWNWSAREIEYEGRLLRSVKVAAVTGEGEESAVQGAMMISTEPVPSVLEPGKACLFVELLFTAPRNRPDLRRDGQPFVIGDGSQLLSYGAWLSQENNLDGRLRLDGSPDFVGWYAKRGLQKLDTDPIVYEGVAYTPMELPAAAAQELLAAWGE